MSAQQSEGPAVTADYRPLWWRPWLEPIAPAAAPADRPDVMGFQMPEMADLLAQMRDEAPSHCEL